MRHGPASFKESDLARAVRAAIKAGLKVCGVEVTKAGDIKIHAGKPDEKPDEDSHEWDKINGDH